MRTFASVMPSVGPELVRPTVGRPLAPLPDRFMPALAALLIAAALPACSSNDRLRDAQVRPMDRPECQVGSQRRDLDAGVPVLIGGTGCRGNPSAPQPLNRRPAEPGS